MRTTTDLIVQCVLVLTAAGLAANGSPLTALFLTALVRYNRTPTEK